MNCIEKDYLANKKYEDAYLGFHKFLDDCRDDEECRKKDVDFKIKTTGEYVELKCGTTVAEKGNIPVEYLNIYYSDTRSTEQKGWLYLSEAKYVVYWDYIMKKEYRIDLANLRRYIYEQGYNIVHTSRIHYKKFDDYRNEISLFYALSVQELQDAGVIINIGDLEYNEKTGEAKDPCPDDADNIF